MIYSYTQIAHYLDCPRRYRYKYLEGWEERPLRAGMVFGKVFEGALAAYFRNQDAPAALAQGWESARALDLDYAGESWEEMLQRGCDLLRRFAEEGKVEVGHPERNLQVQILRPLGPQDDFVGIVDAIGTLDGQSCLLEWKVTSRCYRRESVNLAQLDPQLICYSWLTGIEDAALVVFVRKRWPEIQYLRARITATQQRNYVEVVAEVARQIARAHFPQHPGIRFPQDQCLSCAFSGLCLDSPALVEGKLVRPQESKLGWLDELAA